MYLLLLVFNHPGTSGFVGFPENDAASCPLLRAAAVVTPRGVNSCLEGLL